MALSGQKTTLDYMEWDKLQNLILKLERDGDSKFALLLAIGNYTGLRISDILNLKWNDILDKDLLEVSENNDNSDKSLILLSEMFNHSNIKTTKVYLGIREKEIFDVYDNI